MNKPAPKVTMLELDIVLASNDELKTLLDQTLSQCDTTAVEKVILEMTKRGMTRLSQGETK